MSLLEAHTGRARTAWALFTHNSASACGASGSGAAGGNDAEGSGIVSNSDATDAETLSSLKEACALLPQLTSSSGGGSGIAAAGGGGERASLVRTMASHAQWHIFRGHWGAAAQWLELALSAATTGSNGSGGGSGSLGGAGGGGALPQQQVNQLLMTSAFVALQRLTGAGAPSSVNRAIAPLQPAPSYTAQDLSRIVSTVRLAGGEGSPLGQHILARLAVMSGERSWRW